MPEVTHTHRSDAGGQRILRSYRLREYRNEEVETICRMGWSSLGIGHHPGAAVLRDRLASCRDALTIIECFATSDPRVAGYLILYPLTGPACRRIRQGSLTNACVTSSLGLVRNSANG